MRLLTQIRFFLATAALATSPLCSVGQKAPRSNISGADRRPLRTAPCKEVSAWIADIMHARTTAGADGSLVSEEISPANLRSGDLDCEAVPSTLVAETPLELTKIFFDRTLHSWEFLVRCVHADDCVPFLVRWHQPEIQSSVKMESDPQRSDRASSLTNPRISASSAGINSQKTPHFLVRPGKAVTLVWDQHGIRVVLPAVCVDRGNVGETIRVRTKNGSVLRAEIVSEALLRAIL